MRKKVTITDVARQAEVSVGTVSHYLNGRYVTELRSKRIQKAIDELGFTSNLLAKGMRTQKSSVIGLCVPFSIFPNFSVLVDALERRVFEENYELMQVFSRQDPEIEFRRIVKLIGYKVEGIILVPSLEAQQILDHLHANGMPTVIVARSVPGETRFDQVAVNHAKATYDVAKEMIRRGRRSFIVVSRFPTLIVTRQRVDGVRRAIAASGEDVELRTMVANELTDEFADTLKEEVAKARRPTAIICSNSFIAASAIRALRQMGMVDPAEVALVTLDAPEWAEFANLPLTTVEQPTGTIVDLAWEMLAARMRWPEGKTRQILLDCTIHYRDQLPAASETAAPRARKSSRKG